MATQGVRNVTDEELLDAVAELLDERAEPAVGTKDIADRVGMTRRGTSNRLSTLVDAGELHHARIGNDSVSIYWL